MKLIYLTNARIPTEKAHGIQIMKMAEAFAKIGVELELVIPRRFNWIKKDPFEYYGVERNFKITKLPCLDLIPLDKYIGILGLWVESISFIFFAFPYVLFKKADTVYTRDKFFLPLSLLKKNIIFEAHSISRNHFLYSLLLKKIRGAVVTAQNLKDFFVKNGMPAKRIIVVPNGVDLEKFQIAKSKFQIREELALPQDKKIVLYAGHLYEWKGVQTLAEASQHLPEDIKVYFVGGTERDVEKFKTKNLKLKINVVGYRSHDEIPLWLKAADVLVLPDSAKGDPLKYGASPLKMFEYMASKRPIVASDLSSITEVLGKDNAVLVKPDNPELLAQGINEILQNPQLSDKISERAFQDVQNHAWEKRAQKILEYDW